MSCGHRQHVANIRLASVAWPYGVAPVGERDRPVPAKIEDGFDPRAETVHVPGRVVHRVDRKSNAACCPTLRAKNARRMGHPAIIISDL
jgi:hypothetical protein